MQQRIVMLEAIVRAYRSGAPAIVEIESVLKALRGRPEELPQAHAMISSATALLIATCEQMRHTVHAYCDVLTHDPIY